MISKVTAAFNGRRPHRPALWRPSTPNDQAWIESFFGHLKNEFPHLEKIKDPGELKFELD